MNTLFALREARPVVDPVIVKVFTVRNTKVPAAMLRLEVELPCAKVTVD
jgi:hypothetical protein